MVIELLVLAVVAAVMYAAGKHDGQSKEVCGCGHHMCFHDADGCGFKYDKAKQRCWCRRYIGPNPHKMIDVLEED